MSAYQPPANFPDSQDPIPPQQTQPKLFPRLPPPGAKKQEPHKHLPIKVPVHQNDQENARTLSEKKKVVFDPRTQLSYKIKEIDKSLDNGGWFCIYSTWVLCVIGVSCLAATSFTFMLIKFLSNSSMKDVVLALNFIFCFSFLAYQHWIEKRAMSEKDLGSAKRALILMIVSCIIFFVLSAFAAVESSPVHYRYEIFKTCVWTTGIPMAISTCGAYRVQSVLEEREDLSRKLDKFDTFSVDSSL